MPRKKVIDTPTRAVPQSKMRFVFFGVIALAVVGIFVSLFLGRTDGDAIDVSGVITTSNTAAREAGGENAAQQAVSTYQNLPNGGLVGKGDEGGTPPPSVVEEISSTTASTTPNSTEENLGTDGETGEATSETETTPEGEESATETPAPTE